MNLKNGLEVIAMNYNDFKEGDRVKIIISWSRVQEINKKVKEANPPKAIQTQLNEYISLSGLIGKVVSPKWERYNGNFYKVEFDDRVIRHINEKDMYHASVKGVFDCCGLTNLPGVELVEEQIPELEMTAYIYSLLLKEAEMI